MSALPQPGPSRTRLEEGPDVYRIALEVADALDRADLDLWAAGVRSCLDAAGTTARQQHLVVELVRLSHTREIAREGLGPAIAGALARLEIGLGRIDVPAQPLYAAMRELADHLELGGGGRWLARLRAVATDRERTAAARLERRAAVLARMVPGAAGLPAGSRERVDAVAQRLPRHRGDAEETMAYLTFALQPPAPSRRLDGPAPEADAR
ncbi:hypothetical protein [Euzebya sp.]|uniref:hypothetical protein n=1 Tax=Euzebya sp. TaxID=1971409 RepID=UPI003511AF2B